MTLLSYTDAYETIRENWQKPIFGVRIGMCSPQCEWVDFETALAEFDRCFPQWGDTDLMEYVYMYCMDDLSYAPIVNKALKVLGVGHGR